MPGVVVTTAVRSGPSGAGDIESGQLLLLERQNEAQPLSLHYSQLC